MRIGIVVSPDGAKNASISISGFDDDRLCVLKGLGYDGVELALKPPVEIKKIEESLYKNNLHLIALATGQLFIEEGLSLSHEDDDIRFLAINRVKEYIKISSVLGAPIIIGSLQGLCLKYDKNNIKLNKFISSLCICERYCNELGTLGIYLEPINRNEGGVVSGMSGVCNIIDKIGSNKIKLLADTYHMEIEEKDIIKSLINARKYLGHVHIADTERNRPGKGGINFHAIIKELHESGYNGYLSIEIACKYNQMHEAKKSVEFLKNIINMIKCDY